MCLFCLLSIRYVFVYGWGSLFFVANQETFVGVAMKPVFLMQEDCHAHGLCVPDKAVIPLEEDHICRQKEHYVFAIAEVCCQYTLKHV